MTIGCVVVDHRHYTYDLTSFSSSGLSVLLSEIESELFLELMSPFKDLAAAKCKETTKDANNSKLTRFKHDFLNISPLIL